MILNKLRKSYSNYPALWFCGIYSFGIYCGWYFLDQLNIDWLIYSLIGLFLFTIFFHFFFRQFFIPLVTLLIFIIGSASIYQSLALFGPDDLTVNNVKKIQSFRGWISETHYRKDGNHQYVLELISVEQDLILRSASGKILLKQRRLEGRLNYGNILSITGSPELPSLPSNPGEFNYRRYLQLNDIFFQYQLNDEQDYRLLQGHRGSTWQTYIVQPIREKILAILDKYVPAPTVDILKALILGERQDVDRPILENFQRSGVVHVLAISGLHVGFIMLIFLTFFSLLNLPYRLKIILSLFFLFLFVALVNYKPPVLRASIMVTFYFAAKLTERRGNAMNIIGLAGLLILIFDPRQIFQVGFQFSFAAVGSILYGYPKLSGFLPKVSRFKWANVFNKFIGRPFIVSLTAVLGTTPLTWWYYGSFQLGALLINLMIIPAIGLLVISSFLLLTIGLIGLGFAEGLGTLLHLYFTGILKTIEIFSSLPFVQIDLPNPPILAVLILAAAVFLFFRLERTRRFIYPAILSICISLIFIFPNNNDKLQVTFVNVGQGDGAIIQFPNQSVTVVDAGDYNLHQNAGERYMLPMLKYYRIDRIKYLVGTHAHSDHVGGFLTLLNSVKVDTLVLSGYPYESELLFNIVSTARNKNIPVLFKKRGDFLYPDNRCRTYILHPFGSFLEKKNQSGHEVNNSSIILKIQYAKTSFLLTGDLEKDAEQFLLAYNSFLNADVLKVGHHGSKTSTSNTFISQVQPKYSVISVGRFNKFYHPSRQTVNRLIVNKAHPLRTDRHGGLVFQSDGQNIGLINWRK